MHFHKYPYVTNFKFVAKIARGRTFRTNLGRYGLSVKAAAQDLYHLQIRGPGWERGESKAGLRSPQASAQPAGETTRLIVSADGSMRLEDHRGKCLLSSASGRFFGQCGPASIFEFLREKWTGLEHSGKTTKFWNTDVWADFNENSFIQGKPAPDPVYLSIPYLILRRRDVYLGFLLDNSRATFISTGLRVSIADQMDVTPAGEEAIIKGAEKAEERTHAAPHGFLHLGCEEGQPNLYIIVGPSLAELTRKMQKLMGTTPRPLSGPWAITNAAGHTNQSVIWSGWIANFANTLFLWMVCGWISITCADTVFSPSRVSIFRITRMRLPDWQEMGAKLCPSLIRA
jgi:alpha-glucosidase